MHFILGAKPGDHAYLFQQVEVARAAGKGYEWETVDDKTGVVRRYVAIADMPLNASHPDLRVNFVSCVEKRGDEQTRFSWITDLPVDPPETMLPLIERGGRARWKIENETFNTLKNQGYHFEHNYGHGRDHLATVLMLLMMLAFLVDQAQQIACPLFRAAFDADRCKRRLWENQRRLFFTFLFDSMRQLYETLIRGHGRVPPPLPDDSS